MTNAHPHGANINSAPASRGDIADIAAPSADHNAIARVRAVPNHNAEISASVVGYAMPAAKPPSSRDSASTSTFGARADITAAGMPAIKPMSNMFLRPYRSPIAPRYSTVAASPSENPIATRFNPVCEAPRSLPISGRPTLATARFMFATPAPRIRAVRMRPPFLGAEAREFAVITFPKVHFEHGIRNGIEFACSPTSRNPIGR